MNPAIASLLVAASLGVSSAAPAAPPPSTAASKTAGASAVARNLDAVIDQALAEQRIVGTVVTVVRDGAVLYRRAAGFADREAKKPMREDGVFRLASMTKPLVSVAALALVDQGKLSLEDPVTKWLPDFRPKLSDGREPVITVKHLLTHTSGLAYGFQPQSEAAYGKAGVSDGLDEVPGLTLEENLRRLAAVPLWFEPGQRWSYSLSTDVLGAVVSRAAGAPLPEAVAKLVTKPLGLKDTSFRASDASRLVAAYADGKPTPTRMGKTQDVPLWGGQVRFSPGRALSAEAYASGGAGMVGTAADYVKFLEALRKGGAPVLKKTTVDTLGAVQVGPESQTQGPGWGWGLISAVLTDAEQAQGEQAQGTWQWGGAYGHTWFVDPRSGVTVVTLTNTAFEGMSGAFPGAVRDAVYAGLKP
ncbi:beta-lactamase family protein [Myxococcus sp. K38C18041901]|uniref:serine hydrolase domain-containing protein n=1 Tax=Myxococcus guangdongensis TaxID=2906760 RepID=UPI0020A6FA37|nr:serine hydrolase domain-containing protein [Myxococcus guangdongensis]MCP3059174.1 beta-lactamase family protein [Myxococcus guangdongensis]